MADLINETNFNVWKAECNQAFCFMQVPFLFPSSPPPSIPFPLPCTPSPSTPSPYIPFPLPCTPLSLSLALHLLHLHLFPFPFLHPIQPILVHLLSSIN